ncbi:MAG: biotin/lipoyl-binding protein [Methyloprofundus sp.]|nr:biotin/lipoyl-binding protein [Methyloprofundus sp.]
MKNYLKYLLSGVIVLIAVVAILLKYWDYVTNPWTRDGQVRANVIQVAARVTGPIIHLPIKDNQFVKAGDLLFEIDPRTYKASLDQARANYDETLDDIAALEKQVEASKASVAQFESAIVEAKSALKAAKSQLRDAKVKFQRNQKLIAKGTISKQRFDDLKMQFEVAIDSKDQSMAALLSAKSALLQAQASLAQTEANLGAPGAENARLRGAKAAVDQAQLNLEFTQVKASVDGYVSNLNLQLGSQAVANQPALALVDVNSYWIDAYFRETLVGGMSVGDTAFVTLMSYPDTPISGKVDSLGWGIAQSDGSTGYNLLPNVSPTFEWIRLAQRIPVKVYLDELPEGIKLRIGSTASVLVMTGQ